MIYITLTPVIGQQIVLNIEAIGYLEPYEDGSTKIYITGGTGGEIDVRETVEVITQRLKEAGCEFV